MESLGLVLLIAFAAVAGLLICQPLFHLAAYTVAIGTTANTDITALTDDILPITNGHFIPPNDYDLIAACVMSPTLTRARLNSGTIRQINPTYIRPITAAAVPGTNPGVMNLRRDPFRVKGQEELALEATSGVAMTERLTGLIWLERRFEAVPVGDVYIIRASSTTAAVANAWTTIALTFETGLPAGRYAIIDSDCQSTNAIAHRFMLDNQFERPGNMSITAVANRKADILTAQMLGKYGEFSTYSLPRCQVLCNSADNAHDLYISVVKIG